MLFLGRYNNSIDAKGRLVMPAKFREKLLEGGDAFVICGGFEHNLYVFSMPDFEDFSDSLMELPQSDPKARALRQFFLAHAVDVEPDKQGRVLIPEDLLKFAQIEKDVVVAGNGKHVEIWSRSNFPEADSFGDVAELAEGLSAYGLKL
ncbi:MAG: division/cell wall cluster transcriptional repressor MraZ [Lachnospiraceae bacterium]|jgi:MraZ protein|nr:division/cell wall cluster transcriptional repressor MraZ [Lachnospiraceae bacterium]